MSDKKDSFQVKVNDNLFSFTREEIENFDVLRHSPLAFNVINKHQSINTHIIASDLQNKKITIEVDGTNFEVEIKTELDLMLNQMGFSAVSAKQIKEIKAPMPGLVLEINVKEGQHVNEGDKLLILEAMKMENSIVIQAPAIIKKIIVKAGQAVEKGQLLIELE